MNIFLIPSWYPSEAHPFVGSFTQEQAHLFAELYPDTQVVVSVVGSIDAHLSVLSPWAWPRALAKLARQARFAEVADGNFIEWRRAAPQWTFFLGGFGPVIRGHRRNFELARQRFGAMDVIHAHVAFPGGWAAMEIARDSGVPFMITEHMSPFPFPAFCMGGRLSARIRRPMEAARAIVAVSPWHAERIASFGLPKPVAVPNVVDERVFRPIPAGTRDDGPFRFLTVGGMIPQKGIPDLLRAAREVAAARPMVRFRIAGTGPNLNAYRRLARELGVAGQVDWLGAVPRSDMPDAYAGSDAVVVSSRHESFSVVCVEAIACGKPVVATRCGGPESILTPACGILVPVSDIAGLRDAMLKMIGDREAFRPEQVRECFMGRLSREAVLGRIREMYQRVAGGERVVGQA
ncbi:MAG: glycosyltransferase [Verrucomicrobiota bacterium]|nr:glycosyltransferase [Verrucomicrobiota bacterium]